MEDRPHALLLKFPGTNCDEETARALRAVGFATRTTPITRVERKDLDGVVLLVLSGGFSYGDYVMAGRIAQLEIERRLGTALKDFRDRGGHVLGICNGFQILVRTGMLPPGSLIDNTSGRFQCRWVKLAKRTARSPFLQLLPEDFELPIAHAEGRFVTKDEAEAAAYLQRDLAALTYEGEVNGSYADIAGLQDESGRVFGLMPHPERFIFRSQHYDREWSTAEFGWGHYLFLSIHQSILGSLKSA